MKAPTIQGLRNWNIGLGVLHLVLAVTVVVALYAVKNNRNKDKTDVWRTTPLSQEEEEGWRYKIGAIQSGTLHLGVLLAVFAAITAAAHFFYGTSPLYGQWLTQGWNPGRWLEYAVTATLMVVVIAFVDGTKTQDTVALLALMTAATMAFGFLGESRLVNGQTNTGASKVEWITSMGLFLGVWAVLGLNFFTLIKDSNDSPDENKPPSWLWAVYFTQFLFFASFAGVHAWRMTKGASPLVEGALKAEGAYTTLSVAAKATLIGLLLGGLLS